VLLDNPPPRMLAKFREHGWWRFHGDLDEEDRMVLIALQDKYRERPPSPSSTAEATLPEAGT
jgi:hypothetical protein